MCLLARSSKPLALPRGDLLAASPRGPMPPAARSYRWRALKSSTISPRRRRSRPHGTSSRRRPRCRCAPPAGCCRGGGTWRPAGSELRIIAVRDGERAAWRWRPGSCGAARGGASTCASWAQRSPTAWMCSAGAGREREAAPAIRRAIASVRPRPDLIAFEAVPASSSLDAPSPRARRPGTRSPGIATRRCRPRR